jgi:uncharacterized protein (DUF58 family)
MIQGADLRAAAEGLAGGLPPLLAEAAQLANAILLGEHGRRRAGTGDTFWQYRPAQSHDSARSIDWRRSARSDAAFVQDKEWQIAQSVMLWVDQSAAMQFTSADQHPPKAHRARTLALATAILLIRGGERVGLCGPFLPASRGEAQLQSLCRHLTQDADNSDYGSPSADGLPPHSRALFISDFMGDMTATVETLLRAADHGVRGAILQILDPTEETFPFAGRTIFTSMGGSLRHETLKAADLRDRYLDRLAARKDRLHHLARTTGWQFSTHHTNVPASQALLWIYAALERT